MNYTGEEVVNKIALQLNKEGKDCHDYQILNVIRSLTKHQFAELATFGTLAIWVRKK